jgi:hypothetical protein
MLLSSAAREIKCRVECCCSFSVDELDECRCFTFEVMVRVSWLRRSPFSKCDLSSEGVGSDCKSSMIPLKVTLIGFKGDRRPFLNVIAAVVVAFRDESSNTRSALDGTLPFIASVPKYVRQSV